MGSEPDPWKLLKSGRRAEAFEIWESLVRTRWAAVARRERSCAWLLLGEPEKALDDAKVARGIGPRVVDPWIGTIFWVLGRREEACQDWAAEIAGRHDGTIELADVAGGVFAPALLWWASAHPELRDLRRVARTELRQRWRTKRCQRFVWPGTLAGFLLGERSAEDLLAAAESGTAAPRAGFTSKAQFYIAAFALDRGEGAEYQRQLERVLAEDADPVFWEYFLARAELERLTESGKVEEQDGRTTAAVAGVRE